MASLAIPSQSEVERAFAADMEARGFRPGHVEADKENFTRFDAPGDRPGKGNGFYKLRSGKYPVGWYGDWKSGESYDWQFDHGRELTKKERADIKAEHRRLKMQAQVALEAKQREVAEDASNIWGRASAEVEGHPYLEKKRVDIARGVKLHTAKDGTRLIVVPMFAFDHNGVPQLQNLQFISAEGEKRFMKAGRKQGCFFSLKGDGSFIVICEGYSTGVAIWRATGFSVVCAIDAGNLIEVAKDFARHRPHATLFIAGDNDAIAPGDWEKRGNGRPWVNAGRLKAEAAAKAVGCRWMTPVFLDGPARDRTDFNDLFVREGEAAVGDQIKGALRTREPEEHNNGVVVEGNFVQDESWRTRLPKTANGNPDGNNVEGVGLYIENHRLLRGRLAYNAFSQVIELDGNELADYHVAEFRRIMHKDLFRSKKGDVADEMLAEARRNTHDPLSDYLQGVSWDGTPRLDNFLHRYAGAPDTHYTRTIGRKFMVGAVARALQPGVKLDTMLVFEGDQGTGKSTFFRYLFGDRFFIDHLPDFSSKDSFMQLQGAWCVEVAELQALGKAEVGDVKQYLSRLVDKFRPPFGKLTVQIPRRVVFVGTVNPIEGEGYLKDPTGARRFWPTTTSYLALEAVLRDRDQLWAEAVDAYRQLEPWHLSDPDALAEALAEQEARREVDPWEAPLREYFGRYSVQSITIESVLTDVFKMPIDRQDERVRRRAGRVLRALKWTSGATERYEGRVQRVFHPPGWRDRD